MKFRAFFCSIMLWLFTVTLFSVQATTLLHPLTPEQGLSHSSVRDLLIDADGFLWIATSGGLNRYDSNQIKQLNATDHNLKDQPFSRLLEDSSGRLWALAVSSGLYLYNKELSQFELYIPAPTPQDHQRPANLMDIAEYDSDTLLLLINDSLYKLSLATRQTERLFHLPELGMDSGWLTTLVALPGHIFIGSMQGLIHYDMNTTQRQYLPYLTAATPHSEQRYIRTLLSDEQRLWIGTADGLYSIWHQDIQHYLQQQLPYQATQHIEGSDILKLHRQQHLWVATDTGLYQLDTATNQKELLVRFSDSQLNLIDNTITDIEADAYGGFWLASRTSGAYYWHPRSNAFRYISQANGYALSNNSILSVYAPDQQHLWLGTSNGLNRLDLTTSEIKHFLHNPAAKSSWHSSSVWNMFPAENGKLWFTSGSGLNLFDTEQGQILPLPALSADQLNKIQNGHYFYLHDGLFYFATADNFITYNPATAELKDVTAFKQQLQRRYYGGILGQLTNQPHQLLVGASDQIWLYDTHSQQLTLLYHHQQYMPNLQRRPNSMLQDKNGVLWVAFPGIGLLGFNSTDFSLKHHLSTENGLQSEMLYGLQADSNNNIWFSSPDGIGRLSSDTLQLEYFTRTDGLPTLSYHASAYLKLPSNRLVYGGAQGLIVVEPEKLLTDNLPPDVIITDAKVLSGELQQQSGKLNGQHINLSYQDLGLELHFSSLNYRDSHKMRYHFWLEGKQTVHYPPQSGNQVIFPQLSSGSYTFNVVAVSPVSGLKSEPATLHLHIAPPPWRSQWAISFYILILIVLLYWFYRIRRKQQAILMAAHNKVKLNEQRLKLALESVNSGAWEWQAKDNTLYASRIHTMLGYSKQMNPLTLHQHQTLIHPDDSSRFEQKWQRFIQQPEQGFDLTYRLQHKQGHWLWFRDQGKAIDITEHGQVQQVLGTYSNITENRAMMEKAKLFGEAFQQTRDWVVILDERQRMIAANQSFSTAFGNVEHYLEQPRIHHLGISLGRRRFYTKLLGELQCGEHWQGEELVLTPDGRERPTLINASAIGEKQQVAFYVLVFTDITAQKLAEDELRYLANYDALTGLPNRALLMDRIHHGIEQAKRDKRSLALCFIDLDKFKQINDSLGHDVGDLLLKEVARRLTLTLRESDTVARLGGDEFVVLLEGYKAEDNISHVCRKILTMISEPMLLGSHTVGVSPSIGIAVYPDDALNASELLKHADVAMYHAKEAGRNNFQFFTAEMNEKAHMQLAREARLRKALQYNEFINYYQPIINTENHSIVGAEVLLRWHSSSGMVSPSEFIPLAEELRLIINMTQQLLERALADLQQWWQAGYPIYLSVNLSVQHLEQPQLAEQTRQLLEKYQLPASCLRFEVTESTLMRDHQRAIETMLALNALGIQLALDDFGTGYSSLKYLKELPIDGIKIDRSFVQDIGVDRNDETIINAMLSMASSLGMYCVAEGVETEQQLAFFSQRQCYLIQGYLFAKPMPAAELFTLLQNESNQHS